MDARDDSDARGQPQDEPSAAPQRPPVAEQIAALRQLRAQIVVERHSLINLQRRLLEQRRDLWRKRVADRETHARPVEPEAAPLDPAAPPPTPVSVPAAPLSEPLTARELEVVRLLARGHTNREIARRLGITLGTAKVHVEHILAKLRARSRAHAAAEAIRLGLLPTPETAARPGIAGHPARPAAE